MSESTTSLNGYTGTTTGEFIRVLVTGGRKYEGSEVVEAAMLDTVRRFGDTIFINGGADGADTYCSIFCLKHHWPFYCYPAPWEKHGGRKRGNPAGPIRNKLMLTMHPDVSVVLAFHSFLPNSSGTYGMCELALKANIPVLHYDNHGFRQAFMRLTDLPSKEKSEVPA